MEMEQVTVKVDTEGDKVTLEAGPLTTLHLTPEQAYDVGMMLIRGAGRFTDRNCHKSGT